MDIAPHATFDEGNFARPQLQGHGLRHGNQTPGAWLAAWKP